MKPSEKIFAVTCAIGCVSWVVGIVTYCIANAMSDGLIGFVEAISDASIATAIVGTPIGVFLSVIVFIEESRNQ